MKIIGIIDAVRFSDGDADENTPKNKLLCSDRKGFIAFWNRFRETCRLVFVCQGWFYMFFSISAGVSQLIVEIKFMCHFFPKSCLRLLFPSFVATKCSMLKIFYCTREKTLTTHYNVFQLTARKIIGYRSTEKHLQFEKTCS